MSYTCSLGSESSSKHVKKDLAIEPDLLSSKVSPKPRPTGLWRRQRKLLKMESMSLPSSPPTCKLRKTLTTP